jgi:UDP-glucose 4-epimerase
MANVERTADSGRTCLVTGGAGFIGSHVAEALLRAGHKVLCFDNLTGGYLENVPENATFVRGDITDGGLLARLFAEHQFQFIFHFGAFASEGLSHFVRHFTFHNNQCGTATLINSALNSGSLPLFVFASSAAVYGKASGIFTEAICPEPCDPYGISKLASELDLRAAADFFGLPFIIFRLHNVYGPRQNLIDPFRNVVAIFLKQLMQGKPLTLYGDGSQTRQFTAAADVATLIAKSVSVADARDETFNLGADRSISVLELARTLCGVLGKRFEPEFLPTRNEAHQPACSHAKVKALFGDDMCGTSLNSGLIEMCEWAMGASQFAHRKKPAIEVGKNLPAHWKKEVEPATEIINITDAHHQKSPHEQRHRKGGKSRRHG